MEETMKSGNDLARKLPGFRMFTDFFAGLQGKFKPTTLAEGEKDAFIRAICNLNGSPKESLLSLRLDLRLTAKVREARRYEDGRTFIRYEFRRLKPDCTWTDPFQLTAVFDASGILDSYTVLRGRGEMSEGLEFAISPKWYEWDSCERTNDSVVALECLQKYPECEVAVSDLAAGKGFAYIYGRGGRYSVEGYICCEPWLMTVGELSFAQVEAAVDAVKTRGMKGFEDALEWRQFDFRKSHREHGVLVDVDANLFREMEFAKKKGDVMRVKTVQALGIGGGEIAEPYSIRIPSGSFADHRRAIFNMALNEEDKTKVAKLFAMLAMQGSAASRNNLGYHFHFGLGVPVDYDIAIYWHTLAAKAGDAYSMTNLGNIFSGKDSPRWDGPKAVKWLEKAVAKGETWGMNRLAHCLLCGQCGGKDVVRARSLLKKAADANPDRKDFAEDLQHSYEVPE